MFVRCTSWNNTWVIRMFDGFSAAHVLVPRPWYGPPTDESPEELSYPPTLPPSNVTVSEPLTPSWRMSMFLTRIELEQLATRKSDPVFI